MSDRKLTKKAPVILSKHRYKHEYLYFAYSSAKTIPDKDIVPADFDPLFSNTEAVRAWMCVQGYRGGDYKISKVPIK